LRRYRAIEHGLLVGRQNDDPDAELRKITVDYTIEFALVLRGSSPNAAFSFLSGSGADPTGRSRIFHCDKKGANE
jgi:hypothetical protein